MFKCSSLSFPRNDLFKFRYFKSYPIPISKLIWEWFFPTFKCNMEENDFIWWNSLYTIMWRKKYNSYAKKKLIDFFRFKCTFLKLQWVFFSETTYQVYIHFLSDKEKLANDSITIWTIKFHNKYFSLFSVAFGNFRQKKSNIEAIRKISIQKY